MRYLLTLLISALPLVDILSQEAIGPNPPGMKWRQIDTPAGKVIFPKGLDSLAFRAAHLVNYQRLNDGSIAGNRVTQSVPQIIQNQSTLPAGFSTPAPWRNEYFITPPANMFLGPVAWTDAMEIHEYRHAQQFAMGNQGFTLPYKMLLGQTGWLLNTLITQPLWFREGDAVLGETIFTTGGRGRLPSFHMEYRALRLAGYRYDYEKAHYTSLRNFVPNPYRIGYYMVTRARREYGNDIWNKILNDAYRKKGFVYPFSRSLRKLTGYTSRQFYNETVLELDSIFTASDKQIDAIPSRTISDPKTRKYTNYRFPQFVDDAIVVQKSALDEIPTYYRITRDGREQKLFTPGRYTDDHITLVIENKKMVWAESGFHERYINKDYSILRIFDFATGKTRKLSSRTRYFSPAISRDGTKVFATETDLSNRYFNLILDAESGDVRSRKANPEGIFLSHPRWIDDTRVVCIAVSEKGNALVTLNTATNGLEILIPFTPTPISRPFPSGNLIYFSAGLSEVNNIFVYDPSNGKVFQLTSVRFGAFEPVVSADGTRLVFSEYTADGYRIKELSIDRSRLREVSFAPGRKDDYFLRGVYNSEEKDITGDARPATYEVKKFNALTYGLFNFYGWFVLPNIPEYGAEFYTQNLMSTLRGTAGVLYNTNENRFHYYARATYAAFYPILELEYHRGNRYTALVTTDDVNVEPFDQTWREDVVSAGIRLPFRLTQGTHHTTLDVEGYFARHNVNFLDTAETQNIVSSAGFNALRSMFRFSRTKFQAQQQFLPQWGQVLEGEYNEGTNQKAALMKVNALLYFPGLYKTHSLSFRGAFKAETILDAYRFTDQFTMVRGFRSFPFEELSIASANYQLPLLYPDVSLRSVAFIQRFRWNIFYDYAVGTLNDRSYTMKAPGTELYTDLRLFRLIQMTMCFRYTFAERDVRPSPEIVPFQFLITRFELVN